MLIALLILFPMLAAPAVYALGRKRNTAADNCTALAVGLALALSLALTLNPATLTVPGLILSGLAFHTSGFRAVYSVIASALWLGAAPEHLASYRCFFLLTLGAVQGVLLASDFLTAFVFFEILSFSSFPWVAHERTAEAIRAGCTYLAIAVIGGMILLMGLFLLQNAAGTLKYAALPAALSGAGGKAVFAAAVCILLGFGAKAGMFPLHVWLPKAHPVAPAPASALLSGLLTKVGIFGILALALYVLPEDRAFGLLVLILGLITMALGAVLALFSVNLKRTLACSSMSQIGFILVGISAMALNRAYGAESGAALSSSGVVLHMVNHSLLKLVLFLSAGAAAMNLHTLDLNKLRGWGRNKPVLKLCFAIAALGISGVPLFNGYLSKTLLHEGLAHLAETTAHPLFYRGAEALFLCSGGLTFAYMLKLYLCLFHEKNTDPARQGRYDSDKSYMTPLSAAVLLAGAAALLALGAPPVATRLAALMTGAGLSHFSAFAWENLKGAAVSLAIGAAVYLGFVRTALRNGGAYRDLRPAKLDLEDAVYRPLLLRVLPGGLGAVAAVFGENRVLRPLCRGLVFAASVIGRALDSGLDALILLLRRTLLREDRVRDGRRFSARAGWLRIFGRATGEALSHVLDNFSFAVMMTCAGILLVLFLLVVLL